MKPLQRHDLPPLFSGEVYQTRRVSEYRFAVKTYVISMGY